MAANQSEGTASDAAQKRFRAVARQLERGTLPLADAMALARRLAPGVLADVVSAQHLPRQDARPGNLRVLEGYLTSVATRGRRKRLRAQKRRFDQALQALGDPTQTADPVRWARQFGDVIEDDVLAALARYGAHRVRHATSRETLDRRQALCMLVEVAVHVLQLDLPLPASGSRRRVPRNTEQLPLPFR